MRHCIIFFFLIASPFAAGAQDHDFEFGHITWADMNMKTYDKDTTAEALVLDEFGEAYFDNAGDHNLIFEHHIKIKILKANALERANFSFPLYRDGTRMEHMRSIQASSFTVENNRIQETKLENKSIFSERKSENLDYKKFAIPNVKVGSIIEVKYVQETPWVFNFHTWLFQDDIPKLKSEYWATMPANYIYNVTLKGFLKLTKNESELVKDCFTPGGGNRADCSRMKLAMRNIPAFVEEDYMTASSNFISGVYFELSEIKFFDGRVDKITKEWKDVEDELRRNPKFGVQLKRGKDISDAVDILISGETDPLAKARKVYGFIKEWYKWNGEFSKYCDNGIRKAFDSKQGNVGDINLSLIAALRFADLDTDPIILSTRANGLPNDLHPVLSDFNYVIAKVNIGDKVYLLDATEPNMPFGMIPLRCLNGKGRVLGDKESYWYDLKPSDKEKTMMLLNLKLEDDGYFRGTLQNIHMGYDAVEARHKIYSHSTQDEYVKELDSKLGRVIIKNATFDNLENIDKPLVEKFDVEIEGFDDLNRDVLLLNPYPVRIITSNPFKSTERLYPVDFAAPIEEVVSLVLEFPETYAPENLPESIGLALPNSGGKFVLKAEVVGNKLILNHSLTIARTVYSSAEYHYLKELFDNIIQVQNTDIVFKRK